MLIVIMGDYFNAYMTFPNIYNMHLIVLISIMGLYTHWCNVCIKGFVAIIGEKFHQKFKL